MTGEKGTLPLIRTKPYRPRISGDLVPRLRLLERLERWRDRALPFVVAPAGDGKTTLVTGGRAAWNWPNCSAICPERFTRLVIANA